MRIVNVGHQVGCEARFLFLETRVVMAGVPTQMPLVTIGFSGSLGIAFLLIVIWALPRSCLGLLATVMPLARRSTSITWLSVRPLTLRSPRWISVS